MLASGVVSYLLTSSLTSEIHNRPELGHAARGGALIKKKVHKRTQSHFRTLLPFTRAARGSHHLQPGQSQPAAGLPNEPNPISGHHPQTRVNYLLTVMRIS